MEYIDLVKARRSTYMLENKQVVEDDELVKSLEEVIKEAPTAFNSMATHIVIALGKEHAFIWDTTKGILKGIVSPEAFKKTPISILPPIKSLIDESILPAGTPL